MKRFKGTVKNNVVVLEDGVHLPDGTEVDVCVPARRRDRAEAFQRVLDSQVHRYVGIDEVIERDKRARDERGSLEGTKEE
jgi:hypothetical protein